MKQFKGIAEMLDHIGANHKVCLKRGKISPHFRLC
jgi:hypothetical protein